MNTTTREILGALIGAGAFMGFTFGLNVSLLFSIPLALASYVGVRFLVPVPQTVEVDLVAPGVAKEDWQATLAQGDALSQQFKALAKSVTPMRDQIIGLGDTVTRITQRLREQPGDHQIVGNFLRYEAKTVIPVIQQYVDLSSETHKSPAIREGLERQEKLIPLVRAKMEEQYQKLLSNDLLEFEVASETLATMLGVDELDRIESQK